MTGGAFAPFRYPVFRAIWLATVVASFGSVIQAVGAAWLMTTISGSARMVALVQASSTLPILMLALVAGAIADNYDRRLVMLAAQSLMLAASAALATLTFVHGITPAWLLSGTLLVGCGTALHGPSWQASLRSQVPLSVLPAGVALNSIGFNLARSLGPAIGGLIMAFMGPAANFTINTCSYVFLIAVLLRWRPEFDPVLREPLGRAIRTGVVHVRNSPPIRRALVRAAVFGTLTAGLWALMPLVARDLLHGDSKIYGLVLGAFGLGAIIGAMTASIARRAVNYDRLFCVANLGFATAAAGVSLTSQLFVVLPLMVLAGASWVASLSTVNIVVQMNAPSHIVGRCLSLYHMHAFGGLAIGSYVWGSVADRFGVAPALLGSGTMLALSTLLSLRLPLPPTGALAEHQ